MSGRPTDEQLLAWSQWDLPKEVGAMDGSQPTPVYYWFRDLAAECLRLREANATTARLHGSCAVLLDKKDKQLAEAKVILESSIAASVKTICDMSNQFAAAKALCEASKRHHNRDFHMMKKWADECDLCIAHKEFRTAMKEAEL